MRTLIDVTLSQEEMYVDQKGIGGACLIMQTGSEERSPLSITVLKPFIPSGKDFGLALQFFRDLGFQTNWQADGLAELQLGAAIFILQDFHNQEMQENLMIYAGVDDLDAWWRHIQYPGVRAKEPTVYPWGKREVHLIDPAGVCWHFA